jgi:hypothetical protein
MIGIFLAFSCASGATVLGNEILTLNLRDVPESDKLLETRYLDREGFYSLRPLAGFKKDATMPRGGKTDPLRFRVRFKQPSTGDVVEAGVGVSEVKSLDKVSLSRLRGDLMAGLRQKKGFQVVGSELFIYDRYTCLQVVARGGGQVILLILMFEQPGEFLEITYSIGERRYPLLSRQVEASIATVEWPDMAGTSAAKETQKPGQK